jgi:DNA polymerase I-like protein with 3'-5' exonuclease and polymerase domains
MRELRTSLSKLRLNEILIGPDGRNRVWLSPFGAKTGRNTPSNAKFIFGPSTWIRGLIKPRPGYAIAYVDWSQQEFGIAAYLSGDLAMIEAYESGDPYLTFGKQAGLIPPNGTKQSHPRERELCKTCILGVQYSMGARSLGQRIGRSEGFARDLLKAYRRTYPAFWRWSDGAVSYAMMHDQIHSVFGWTTRPGFDPNPRSLRNFPCQGNGAEILRLACSIATERGIQVDAPVHDAVLVEGPSKSIDEIVTETHEAMAEASGYVLGGPRLRSDAMVVKWPGRYMDERGAEFWDRVMGLIMHPINE